jgi:drug/metabolite transporter (DMT)-like permease
MGGDLSGLSRSGAAPLVAILGAFLIACELILVRFLVQAERMLSMLLHVNGFAAALLAVPVLIRWHPVEPVTLALLGLLGPLAIAGQMCNVRGYRLAGAAWLAPFGYSSVAFSALIGWVAFGTVPTPATLAGTALIVGGGVMLLRR